jgi:hypothetical protein
MAMVVIVVVTAIYLTLLNFKRLRELTRWIKRLVIGLFLVYGGCGLYLIFTEDSPGEVMKTFIPYFGISLLVAGIRYFSKKRRARQKNWSVDDYPIVYDVYPVMASQDRMVALELEAVVFFKTIFGWDYYDLFISDKSSLYDLCLRDEFERIQVQIKEAFGIEVGDSKMKIVDILEQIRTNQPLEGE